MAPSLDIPPAVLPLAADDLKVHRLDFLPIALAVLRKMGVAATIDAAIPAPPPRPPSALAQALGLPPPVPPPSVGVCAEAMILNILEGRVALSQMEAWLRGLDLGTLWGPDVQPAQFTDDRLARGLDALFAAGTETLYSQIVVTLGRVFCVELDRLHFDTSSLRTFGAHAVPADAPGPRAVQGYSKDHRPDLLQWVFGMTVQQDGLPVLSTLLDGNTADALVHRAHLELLATQVRDPAATTFVSDSKGCNAASLGLLRYLGFHFTTLLPHTFAEHDRVIDAALAQPDAWCELAHKQAGEAPARVWRGCVVPVTLPMLWPDPDGEGFPCEARFHALVVHSTELARTHAHAQAARLAKGRRQLAKQSTPLAATDYACVADAEAAVRSFVATHAVEGLTLATTITEASVRQKRPQRGRPRADDVPTYRTVYRVVPTVTDDAAAQTEQARHHGLFVLVTSHRIGRDHPATTTFEEYHGQEVVEAGFRWIKGPGQVSPILLHTPARIAALSFLFTVTLLLYRLLQREIRRALATTERTVPGPNRVPTRRPTTQTLMNLFAEVYVVRATTPAGPLVWLVGWKPIHAQILKWFDLPPDLYRPAQEIQGVT
jgi:transposase